MHGVTRESAKTISSLEPRTVSSSSASSERNVPFACMANVLSMKENKTFGKHIIANSDIDVGKIVIAASAFASIDYLIHNGPGCFQCGKESKSRIQCPYCIDVWFCSDRCKSNRIHRNKCDSTFKSSDCSIIRLMTRVITVACNSVDEMTALLEFSRGIILMGKKPKKFNVPYSQYGEILTLKGQPDVENSAKARRVVNLVIHRTHSSSLDVEEKKRILFYIAYQHANSIPLNAFSEKIDCSKNGSYVRFSIFDVLSRFNHSCVPNLEHYIDNDYDETTYCISTRSIKAGEQLFINYLCGMNFPSNQERKKYIKETWQFDCKCQLCCQE